MLGRDDFGDYAADYPPGPRNLKARQFSFFRSVESVDLALKILDKSQIRGKTLSVQRAKFQMKGETYDPALKPKRKKKDKERQKKLHEK
ncbi:hypothetical protein K0M31_003343 [Melipona bicolor]|uniref:Uncharacterized protein n=1 Tax=Melipona bicolor TaxID=60889 RepID=A0AA40FYR1_9HYME|nr:hypothetical protein K0M31_003343 [Melipona bicolor]